jgi:hypothetical protein
MQPLGFACVPACCSVAGCSLLALRVCGFAAVLRDAAAWLACVQAYAVCGMHVHPLVRLSAFQLIAVVQRMHMQQEQLAAVELRELLLPRTLCFVAWQ